MPLMQIRMFRCTMFFLIVLNCLTLSGLLFAADDGLDSPPGLSLEEASPAPAQMPLLAIGAMSPTGEHLVRPREGVVERILRSRSSISPEMTPGEIRTAVNKYYRDFARQSSAWISPAAQERALSVDGGIRVQQPIDNDVSALRRSLGAQYGNHRRH